MCTIILDLGLTKFFVLQNPYMKEKFVLVIETLHEADRGEQDNVSHVVKERCNYCFAFLYRL